MIDNFALFVSHALMMVAAVLLMRRPDLDSEPPTQPEPGPRPDA